MGKAKTVKIRKSGSKDSGHTPVPTEQAMEYLLSTKRKPAEQKKIVQSYLGKFAWVGYGVDDFLKDKKEEIELEDR